MVYSTHTGGLDCCSLSQNILEHKPWSCQGSMDWRPPCTHSHYSVFRQPLCRLNKVSCLRQIHSQTCFSTKSTHRSRSQCTRHIRQWPPPRESLSSSNCCCCPYLMPYKIIAMPAALAYVFDVWANRYWYLVIGTVKHARTRSPTPHSLAV